MKHRILAASIAGALVVVLAGCSNPTSATSPSSHASTTATIAVNALPQGLTAATWGGYATHVVLTGLGSQLFTYKYGDTAKQACSDPSYDITGRLASSYSYTPDGKAIVIKLRNLTSQAGNKLTADDVKWSIETGYVRDDVLKATLAGAGFDVSNMVTVVDSGTVQLNLKTRYSFSLASLQNDEVYIYDATEAKKHVTGDDPTATKWLSANLADFSGWKLDSFVPGSTLVLTADPQWGGERGSIKKVVVNSVPDTATRSELVTSGDVQLANGFDYDQYASFSKDPGVRVNQCTSEARDTLMLNTTKGPLVDQRVRQALSMALDRNAILTGAYSGIGTASTASFPKLDAAATYKYDPQAAKALLTEAGFPHGFPLSLTYGTSRPGPVAAKSAVLIQSMLAKIGVAVTLNVIASSTDLATAAGTGNYQAMLYSESIVIADPAFYTYPFNTTGAPSNSTGWGDPTFDAMRIQLAATPTTDTAKRQSILQQMGSIVDKAVPILALVNVNNTNIVSTSLSGSIPTTNGQVYFNGINN